MISWCWNQFWTIQVQRSHLSDVGRKVFSRPCGGNIPRQWSLDWKKTMEACVAQRDWCDGPGRTFHGISRVLAVWPLDRCTNSRLGFINATGQTVIALMIGRIIADGKWSGSTWSFEKETFLTIMKNNKSWPKILLKNHKNLSCCRWKDKKFNCQSFGFFGKTWKSKWNNDLTELQNKAKKH